MAAVIPGYHGRLLEADLSSGRISIRKLEPSLLKRYIGGSGLGVRLLFDEIPAGIDPLGPDNLLLFLTGPFAGTPVPCGDRTSVACKSPLTGIWAESDVGGTFAGVLRSCGYDGIIIRGTSSTPVYLHISDNTAEIRKADHLWGRDTYAAHELLLQEDAGHGSTMVIGPAGEKEVLLSSIVSDGKDARVAARCGVGAVMGSKKLKAVCAARGSRKVPVYDSPGLKKSLRGMVRSMTELSADMRAFGTSGGVETCHELEDFPVKNWQVRKWDAAGELSGVNLADTVLVKKYHCARCPIGCGRVVQVPRGPYKTPRPAGGPEYETMGSLGGNLMIGDIEAVTLANDLCNRYGMDTISVGQVIGLVYEAYQRGYLSEDDVSGMRPVWGDPEPAIALVKMIGEKKGIGQVLGQGVRRACSVIAGGDPQLDLHIKGLELPSHDPRAFASIALGYATSPRGACHLQAYSHGVEAWIAMPELGFPEILERYSPERKAELTVKMQDLMCLFDSLKMCKFVLYAGVSPTTLVEWLNLVTGWDVDLEQFLITGRRIFELKVAFNRREGVTRKDDTLPLRLATGDIGRELPGMLEEYYAIRNASRDRTAF